MAATVHGATLTEIHAPTSTPMTARVLWTDRPFSRCDWCDQPINQPADRCPVGINPSSGELEERQDQHGCGQSLVPPWSQVDDGQDEAQVQAELLAVVKQMRVDALDHEERRLEGKLRTALADIAAGAAEEDVTTGSELSPGVYHDGESWVAWSWSYDPNGSGAIHTSCRSDPTPRRGAS